MRTGMMIAIALLACPGLAQTAFEVASIKPSQPGARGNSSDFAPGGERFTATNMPIGGLILLAYDITVRQLQGPGTPALSERFDIAAKAAHPVSRAQMARMLQTLLADRFHLVFHRETRDSPVYALVVAKGGPKLRASARPQNQDAARIPSHAGGAEPASGHMVFRDESMADFAWALSRTAGIGDRVVQDRTGLQGAYDFELVYDRDRPPQSATEPRERQGPSIFTAIEEQLGLKLEATRGPVEFLIVDSVEKPSGN